MKRNAKNLIILFSVLVACVAFSLIMLFAGSRIPADTPVRIKDVGGVPVNTVSIADIDGVMNMTAINYIPNDFVLPTDVVSNEYNGSVAKRGTYRFYIDTLTGDEWNDSGRLDSLLAPDGNWHLTIYLPPVLSACSVFVQYSSADYVGTIDRYNIDYYVNFSAPSEFDDSVLHNTATEPLFLDIPISADGKFSKECKVTVHYETDNDNFVGFLGPVLIGKDAAIRGVVNSNRSVVLLGAILGAGTLLLFLLICLLKRSFSFIPQLLFAVGIFAALFSTFFVYGFTTVPYLLFAIRRFSIGFILFASALYLPKKFGKLPVLYPVAGVTIVATVLAFISPFMTSVAAYLAVCCTYIVLACASVVVIFAFVIRDIYKGKPLGLRLNTIIVGVSVIIALFSGLHIPYAVLGPTFWLYLGALGVTLVLGIREFVSMELHNRYLTANLEQEVKKQTKSLRDVLTERDNILLYVSHDMKKAADSMGESLTDLRQNIAEPTLAAKVDGLLQKSAELKKDFIDLGKYGRQNYVAEDSEAINLSDLVRNVTDDLRPDCEANGIVMTVTLSESLEVYAKRTALQSVVLNLVMNAIEHSACTELTVSALRHKGMCRLEIVDNGHGITTDKDVFAPFVSGNPSEHNSGLGLFLAKSALESMHGSIVYERRDGLTYFIATLPLSYPPPAGLGM